MPHFHLERIAAPAGLDVVRCRCDGHDPARPVEEVATADVLMLPVRGRFVIRSRHGRAVLDPGRGLLLRAGDRYTASHPGGGDLCIGVRGARIASLDRAPVLALDVPAQLALLALAGGEADGDPDLPTVAVDAIATATAGAGRPAGPADRTIAARITAYVAEHYDQPLAIADVATAAGVSAFHACRAFRRATGASIHDHHAEVRLRHALALVLATDEPLAEIAIATGFANQGHLGNRFRRRFGISPGRARRSGLR